MRHVQAVALEQFAEHGFAAVTIDDIAVAAETSAPTIYRHFGTKEQLVLWDEYDPTIFAAALEVRDDETGDTLLETLTERLVQAVQDVYAQDGERIRRRTQLILREPALQAANTASLGAMRAGLAEALLRSRACAGELEAEVVAGAIATALQIGVLRWSTAESNRALAPFVRRALQGLRALAAPPKRGRR